MKTITRGVPQGSILGPILFNIFMNDLSYAIDECTLFTYADDTQLLKSAEDIDQVEHAINADLKKVDEWYEFNQMQRNHSKYQAITFARVERNPVKELLSLLKMKWISLASLLIISLSLKDRFVKSVAK